METPVSPAAANVDPAQNERERAIAELYGLFEDLMVRPIEDTVPSYIHNEITRSDPLIVERARPITGLEKTIEFNVKTAENDPDYGRKDTKHSLLLKSADRKDSELKVVELLTGREAAGSIRDNAGKYERLEYERRSLFGIPTFVFTRDQHGALDVVRMSPTFGRSSRAEEDLLRSETDPAEYYTAFEGKVQPATTEDVLTVTGSLKELIATHSERLADFQATAAQAREKYADQKPARQRTVAKALGALLHRRR